MTAEKAQLHQSEGPLGTGDLRKGKAACNCLVAARKMGSNEFEQGTE